MREQQFVAAALRARFPLKGQRNVAVVQLAHTARSELLIAQAVQQVPLPVALMPLL